MDETVFTPRELSKRYKVTERMIVGLARSGKLPGMRIGHLWRFRVCDIEIWERHQGIIEENEITKFVNAITS
jgi:excisionase family DNA binding protein